MSVRRLDSGSWQVRHKDGQGRERSRVFPTRREADAYDLDIKRAKMRGELDLFDGGHETLAE